MSNQTEWPPNEHTPDLTITRAGFLGMYLMNYLLTDYIVKILVPTFPLIELLIEELISNNSSIHVSNFAKQEVSNLWEQLIANPSDNYNSNIENLKRLIFLWDNYRSTTLPIFDWLYWLTQKAMNNSMIIDVDECVDQFLIDSGSASLN